jgi:hypothetical protein
VAASDRQSLLAALGFVTAWSAEDGVDAWMRAAAGIQTTAEWEHVATSLAQLAYLLAERIALDDHTSADEVLRGLTELLAEDEADGLAS